MTSGVLELGGTVFAPDAPADAVALRAYRKRRVVAALVERGLAGIVLFNPINIRYASDARNMQVYSLHNPCRYLFLGSDGARHHDFHHARVRGNYAGFFPIWDRAFGTFAKGYAEVLAR